MTSPYVVEQSLQASRQAVQRCLSKGLNIKQQTVVYMRAQGTCPGLSSLRKLSMHSSSRTPALTACREEAFNSCESQSEGESNSESQSEPDTEYKSTHESVEAESDVWSYCMDLPLQSHSVPAAMSMSLNIKAEAQSFSIGWTIPSPSCSISPVSSQDEGIQEVQRTQQEDEGATAETPADLQLRVDSANAKAIEGAVMEGHANGIGSNNKHYCSGLDAGQALLSNREQGTERKQETAQQAPAVATAEHSKQSCLSDRSQGRQTSTASVLTSALARSCACKHAAQESLIMVENMLCSGRQLC